MTKRERIEFHVKRMYARASCLKIKLHGSSLLHFDETEMEALAAKLTGEETALALNVQRRLLATWLKQRYGLVDFCEENTIKQVADKCYQLKRAKTLAECRQAIADYAFSVGDLFDM